MPPKRPTILLAEDNPVIAALTMAILRKEFEAIRARDGEEAVEMARKHRPDAIIMDLMMPVLDGVEAIRTILEDPRLSTIPICAYTAKTTIRAEVEAYEAGCVSVIHKPCSGSDLLAQVRGILARSDV